MSEVTTEQIAAFEAAQEDLLAQAKAIVMMADEAAVQTIYDALSDVMVATEESGATIFSAITLFVASWLSLIGCPGCRTIEVSRMALLAKAISDTMAKQNGGDDAEAYHATRH
jgi:hypothetical protein